MDSGQRLHLSKAPPAPFPDGKSIQGQEARLPLSISSEELPRECRLVAANDGGRRRGGPRAETAGECTGPHRGGCAGADLVRLLRRPRRAPQVQLLRSLPPLEEVR